MVELIDYIDSKISACIGSKVNSFGLCRQIIDDSAVYPVTVKEPSSNVTPSDKWKITIYHRLLEGSFADSEEFSFGRELLKRNSQNVRMVVFIDLSQGESVIDDIIDAIPTQIELDPDCNYKLSETGPNITLIRDRNGVWEQEFGQAYKDKYQMRYNIYAVEYTIDYIKCPACECA